MFRQSLLNARQFSLIAQRSFGTSSVLRALPSVSQGHATEKPTKDNDHDPQTEGFQESRKERKETSQTEGKEKPQTKKPSAGIGLQVPSVDIDLISG
jgi:hypothetical protein